MATVSPAQPKARLSEPLGKVQTGQEGGNTSHGTADAHLSPTIGPRKPLPLRELAEFRVAMPRLRRSSAELLREVRDEGL